MTFIVLVLALETASRLLFSVMLQILLSKVMNVGDEGNKKDVYIYSVFCGIVLMIGQIGRNSAQN